MELNCKLGSIHFTVSCTVYSTHYTVKYELCTISSNLYMNQITLLYQYFLPCLVTPNLCHFVIVDY